MLKYLSMKKRLLEMDLSTLVIIFLIFTIAYMGYCFYGSKPLVCTCKYELHHYVYPDEELFVGLICLKCNKEWIHSDFANWEDNCGPEKVIFHLGDTFLFREKQIRKKPKTSWIRFNISERLEPGDHIKIKHYLSDHHAIVVKVHPSLKKYDVIHFSGGGKIPFTIKYQTLKHSEERKDLFRLNYDDLDQWKDDPKVIIARAYFFLKNGGLKYNYLDFNCESLATMCTYGTATTFQGKFFKKILGPFVQPVRKSLLKEDNN